MESAIESTAKNVGLAALKPKQRVCYWEQCFRLFTDTDMELRSTTAVLKSTQAWDAHRFEPPKVLLITDEGGGISSSKSSTKTL